MLDFLDDHLGWIVGLAIAMTLVAVPLLYYKEGQKPGFELKKDEWTCAKEERHTILVMAGKVMVPQTRTECVQWDKIR